MASNALPLWAELPDGVLKRQLIAEIAQIIKLSESQLADLWQLKMQSQALHQPRSSVNTHHRNHTEKDSFEPYGNMPPESSYDNADYYAQDSSPIEDSTSKPQLYQQYTQKPASNWKKGRFEKNKIIQLPLKGRVIPASRADHLLRLLLSQSGVWSQLSTEEHQTLCHMAGSHGALLNWMDAQFHNFGPQPWSALQIALKENPLSHFANQLMSQNEFIDTDPTELEIELHDLLARIQIDELNTLWTKLHRSGTGKPSLTLKSSTKEVPIGFFVVMNEQAQFEKELESYLGL